MARHGFGAARRDCMRHYGGRGGKDARAPFLAADAPTVATPHPRLPAPECTTLSDDPEPQPLDSMPLSRRDAIARLAALTAMTALPGCSLSRSGGVPDAEPLDGTIANYLAGFHRGRWSAAEVTAAALQRCGTLGMELNAIDALAATALDEARAADARRRAGGLRRPLDGVPVFAKSIYDMAGLPTTASNAEWARLFPNPVSRDALEVARLRAAGAIVLGKTAADDFAYRGNGTSSHTGQVLNPYDATGTRTPGGSSAGSAVAVAAGMAFAALGTE